MKEMGLKDNQNNELESRLKRSNVADATFVIRLDTLDFGTL